MKIVCEICNGDVLVKQENGLYRCEGCGACYTPEQVKKLISAPENATSVNPVKDGNPVPVVKSAAAGKKKKLSKKQWVVILSIALAAVLAVILLIFFCHKRVEKYIYTGIRLGMTYDEVTSVNENFLIRELGSSQVRTVYFPDAFYFFGQPTNELVLKFDEDDKVRIIDAEINLSGLSDEEVIEFQAEVVTTLEKLGVGSHVDSSKTWDEYSYVLLGTNYRIHMWIYREGVTRPYPYMSITISAAIG